MIEGIIVCVLLVLALIGLHFWNKPKTVAIDNLPPLKTTVPMPPVKSPREEAQRYERKREQAPVRAPAASPLYSAPYGKRSDRDDLIQEEEFVDYGTSALLGVVAGAAAVVLAESIYESVVDTSPTSSYSDPTPSSYSEPTSSSWGGDSSSSYDSSSSSFD